MKEGPKKPTFGEKDKEDVISLETLSRLNDYHLSKEFSKQAYQLVKEGKL